MNCLAIKILAPEYFDGSLPQQHRADFCSHLENCSHCATWIDSFRASLHHLAAVMIAPPSDESEARVLELYRRWHEEHSKGPRASKTELRRAFLVTALRKLTPEMKERIKDLKREGRSLRSRPDLLWQLLLQSMATMGNTRGLAGLMRDPELLTSVSFAALAKLPDDERDKHLRAVMWQAKIRMPDRKAEWLTLNFNRIELMGGVEAATQTALALPSKKEKLAFMMQFDGIGPKYGRNVWMDIYDPEFRESIAIDERIKKITDALGFNFKTYDEHEGFYQQVARDAALEPWEVDRLLYQFTDHFIEATRLVRD